MIKGFKIRIYPTREQEQMFWKHIGGSRYIYNYMLALQEDRYKKGESHLSNYAMNTLVVSLKQERGHEWLGELSTRSLQNICKDLDKAYQFFFKKQNNPPKFKTRKKSKPTFCPNHENFYFKDEKFLNIEKIGKIKYKTNYLFPYGYKKQKYYNVRISFVDNKWIITFHMECENQTLLKNKYNMGIDLGIKDLAVVACGDKHYVFNNINKSLKVKKINRKIKELQRDISRKYVVSKQQYGCYKKSNNIVKKENQLTKLHTKVANIRKNYIHQTTHFLVSLLPQRVVMEDLDITRMMQNRYLNQFIGEQCWYEFIRQMKYKCEWNDIEFIQVDTFYPSSKTCSVCGCVKNNLKLSDRTYVCKDCGNVIDRDLNAAINLMRYIV